MATGLAQGIPKAAKPPQTTVPLIGCPSDGQLGPQEAPKGGPRSVQISPVIARQLAYYSASADGLGVLAPRGWYCLNLSGSGGGVFYLSTNPIYTSLPSPTLNKGFSGPVIELTFNYGESSSRFIVAGVMARVFPPYWDYVRNLVAEWHEEPLPFGPYPADKVTYRGDRVVEFRTAGGADGLGTQLRVKKNSSPMDGVAILEDSGTTVPNLWLLSMRLPTSLATLAPAIVRQFERDIEGRRGR